MPPNNTGPHTIHPANTTNMETNAWILQGQNGVASLEQFSQKLPELGDHDILVQLLAVSLNHRDVAIAEVPSRTTAIKPNEYTANPAYY